MNKLTLFDEGNTLQSSTEKRMPTSSAIELEFRNVEFGLWGFKRVCVLFKSR